MTTILGHPRLLLESSGIALYEDANQVLLEYEILDLEGVFEPTQAVLMTMRLPGTHVYQLQQTTTLDPGSWTAIGVPQITPTFVCWSVSESPATKRRFYRAIATTL